MPVAPDNLIRQLSLDVGRHRKRVAALTQES